MMASHLLKLLFFLFFFSSRRRHTRLQGDWSSDVCSSDLLELLHLLEVAAIERRAAADRHRYAVHRERITLAHAHQVMQRLAARHQIVFGEDLEPVDGGAIGKDRFVVIDPQAKTETERRGLQHGRRKGGPGAQRARPTQWLTSLWPSRRRTPPSSSPGTPCPCRSSGPCRRCWRSCTRSVPCRN